MVNRSGTRLTETELRVLEGIWRMGLTKLVASELCLSVRTVESCLRDIYDKLDVHDRVSACRVAFEEGILQWPQKTR